MAVVQHSDRLALNDLSCLRMKSYLFAQSGHRDNTFDPARLDTTNHSETRFSFQNLVHHPLRQRKFADPRQLNCLAWRAPLILESTSKPVLSVFIESKDVELTASKGDEVRAFEHLAHIKLSAVSMTSKYPF